MATTTDGAWATCSACGTRYAPPALTQLTTTGWSRVGGVLCEFRRCICRATVAGTVSLAHPELGADVVLRRYWDGPQSADHPERFVGVTERHFVAEGGRLYRRNDPHWAAQATANGGEIQAFIDADELVRLRAWADMLAVAAPAAPSEAT